MKAMIHIGKLDESDIGRWVVYRSPGGDKVEHGRIKVWNDHFVFVVYRGSKDQLWQNYTGVPTRPEDLRFG